MRKVGALLLAGLPAFGAPVLNGAYHGALGVLQFDTQGDRVSGHYQAAGACAFEPERRLVEGLFEGNVLVGTVILCQEGTACEEKPYPFLAFYNPQDGTLSADVKVEPGCNSPALSPGNRLTLAKGLPPDVKDLDPAAKRRANARKNQELAAEAFKAGQKAIQDGDFLKAKNQFERALSYSERNYVGYFGLGVAEYNLNHIQAALAAYRRAAEIQPEFKDNYYNMACAYARLGNRKEALGNLSKAVKLGFDEPELMDGDMDLKKFHDDPEFNTLYNKAMDLKIKKHRGAR